MNFKTFLVFGLALTLTSCGGGGDVTLELKLASALSRDAHLRGANDQTSSVTIDSLTIPIGDVGLSHADELYGTSNSAYLYLCPAGTIAGCQVELVGTALENLLTGGGNSGNLTSGRTYASVMISTCPETASGANTYAAHLKAKATVGGTLYYTKTGSQYLTSVAADYGPVEITFNSCRNYTVLSQPFTYDGSAVTVNLYIDLRNIAHVYGAGSSLYSTAHNGNCSFPTSGSPATDPYICLEYPDVGGTIKSGAPTIERYKVFNTASASSTSRLMAFILDTDGQPIGGYNRVYIDDVTTQNQVLSTPGGFKKASLSGGNLYFTDYSGGTPDTGGNGGTSVTNQVSTQGNFTVEAFPRPAVGAAASPFTSIKDTNGTTSSVSYEVTRID